MNLLKLKLRGEGGSSDFLLLSEMVGRGSDGGVMEAECHNNIGRTGMQEDGSEAWQTEAKRAELWEWKLVFMSCGGREMGVFPLN